jgi:hypothetical protein
MPGYLFKPPMRMEHYDTGSSNLACMITFILGVFAHWTKSDVAIYLTMMAAFTTVILNVKKIWKDK